MKKVITFFALAFLLIGVSQTKAQIVKLTPGTETGAFVWNFDSIIDFDSENVSSEAAKNLSEIFNTFFFFDKNVHIHCSGDIIITAKYTCERNEVRLTDISTGSEEAKATNYIDFLNGYSITIDHTGVNDGKHFRINFWNDANGGKKPYYQLKYVKVD